MSSLVKEALSKLIAYCERNDFKGFDPYDAQNSCMPMSKYPHIIKFAITQINKRLPFNIRGVLGIRKEYHTKAMGLFHSGYCNLFKITNERNYIDKAKYFLNWIQDNRSSISDHICWGYDYDYTSMAGSVTKGLPTVVHHSVIIQSLYKHWLLTHNSNCEYFIKNSEDFILKDIQVSTFNKGICFGYHHGAEGCCYNASLHATECLAIIDKVNNRNDHLDLVKRAVKYVVSRQKPSGEWYYSHGTNPDREKKQIDFHQGFILDSLKSVNHLYQGNLSDIVEPAIQGGLDYYCKNQFDEKGMGVYRYPQKYPTDIHNQAQGIITFSRFTDLDKKYEDKADSILHWTIENMQDKKGFFYYQKYRHMTNKIEYIRWAQAWMFLAMTEYLLMKTECHND